MNHETQVALIQRVLDLVSAKTKEMVPTQGAAPAASYLAAERLELERRGLFRGLPLIVGHRSAVEAPGDFLTHDASGEPILVVRGDDGALRGFLNVCRHRGTQVASGSGRGRRAFVCPYHGWVYGRDGVLSHVPDGFGFPEVEVGGCALAGVPVQERHGLVWATPDRSQPARDLGRFLGELDAELAGYGLEHHVPYAPATAEVAMNWKLVFDVFLEAYHLKYAHTDSIYPIFFNNLGLFGDFAPHQRNLFPKRTIVDLAGSDPAGWRLRDHANVLYLLFPNALMLVQPDFASFIQVFPLAPDRSRIDTWHLLPEAPHGDKAIRHWDKNVAILMSAIAEDLEMGASIQRGLASGANNQLTFGRFEQGLTRFHRAVAEAVGEAVADAG